MRSGDHERYALSFTSGTLLLREAQVAVPLYLQLRDWKKVRRVIEDDNLLQARTSTSSARLARETVQRLAVLKDAELETFDELSPSERGYLMWVAACRRYVFIGDFAEDVVRERFLLLTPGLSHKEFDRFVSSKSLWRPELTELKDSTLKKLRANVFRMLTEADLLSDGQIQQAVLSDRALGLFNAQDPSDIRFLPARVPMEVTNELS